MTFAWRAVGWFLLLALIWHVPMLFAPTRKKHRSAPSELATKDFYVVMEPEVVTPVRLQLALGDPTIFLLPNDMGFSSAIRRQRAISKMESEVSDPPVEVRAFQTGREEHDLSSFRALTMNQSSLNDMDSIDAPAAAEAPAEEGSIWCVSGGIADRTATATLGLPVITANEVLSPTALRVGVTRAGEVLTVMVEKSSGMDKADEAAVRFAKGLRFAPEESAVDGSLSWGIVKVIWRAERPPTKS